MTSNRLLTKRNKRTVKIQRQPNTSYSVILAAIPVDGRVRQLFPATVVEKALDSITFQISGKMPKRGLWVHMVVI